MTDDARNHRARRRLVDAAVVVVALALGAGGWWALAGDDEPSGPRGIVGTEENDAAAFTVAPGSVEASAAAVADARSAVAPPGTGAPDARAAVERFLTAEASGEWASSFPLLSADDRARVGSSAGWVRDHGRRAAVRRFEILAVTPTGPAVAVTADVQLTPVIDETLGIVPARTRNTYVAVPEGDGWFVDLGQQVDEPRWPAPEGAAVAVERWARARTSCRTEAEAPGGLLGATALADALCDAGTSRVAGDTVGLPPEDSGALVAAYGDLAASLTRVVDVQAPVSLRAVAAPLGDDWTVVAVLAPLESR